MDRAGHAPMQLAADDGGCRCCGATVRQRAVWGEVYADTGQELRRCGHCAAAYLAPDFTEEALARFYAHDYRRLFPAESPWRSQARFFAWRGDRPIAQRRLQWIAPQLPTGARLLEMGSGFGAFLGAAAALRPDLKLFAIEPDLENRTRLLDAAQVTFVPDLHAVAEASVDAVVAFHVLEHLPDPRGFLQTLARVLAPGGLAWIEVPDVMSDWRSRNYVQPAHLSYFSASLLQRLALSAGLEVRACAAHPVGGALADNLWMEVRRPAQACASPLAAARAEEVDALDMRLDCVGWGLRDRLRRALKRAIVRAFGPGLPGEVQRWRGRRQVREAMRDALR